MSKAGTILICLCFVFVVTFTVFPGLYFSAPYDFMINNFKDRKTAISWNNMMVTLIFSILDTIGRWLGSRVNIPQRMVVLLSVLRVVFIATTIGSA